MNSLVNVDGSSVELSVFQEKEAMMSPRKTSPSTRAEAVRRIIEGGESIGDIAREYGVSKNTIHNWKTSYWKMLEKDIVIQQLDEVNEQLEDERTRLLEENMQLASNVEMLREVLRDAMKNR